MIRRPGMRGMVVALGAASILVALATGNAADRKGSAGGANKLAALDTSLRLVPDSAAFYGAAFRNREQLDAVLHSRAWAKLTKMPAVQMGLMFYQMQVAGSGGFGEALRDPQVKEALTLLADMFSHEVFLYGDLSVIDLVEVMQRIQQSGQLGQIFAQLNKKDPSKVQVQMMLRALAENVDRVKAPNFLAGFKLSNRQRAVEQLAKLELILGLGLQFNERTKGALKRTQIAGHDYLVVTLTGAMIPWDQVPLDEVKKGMDRPDDVDKLVAQLKKQKLVVAIGVRENYLLFATGSSTDVVAAFGQGKRLVDRPEFKRLEPYAGRRIASLGYTSKTVRERLLANQTSFDRIVDMVEEALGATGLKANQQQRIVKDLKSVIDEMKSYLPKLGAAVGVSTITPVGYENFSYQWDQLPRVEGGKSLSLLEHLGGSPLFAFLSRGKSSPGDYDVAVKWLGVAWRYVDEFAVPQMKEKNRREFRAFVEKVRPLLRRIDEVNRTMLIPALADGQIGVVLEAKLQSKRFLQALPGTEKPMPMIEPALVLGVSDATLLRKAAGEYASFVQGVLKAAHDSASGDVPVVQLPPPEVTRFAVGEAASYPLPEAWGVDKQLAPTFALSDQVAVITTSVAQAERLLKTTPLAVGGVLGDPKRPRALALAWQWAATVDAVTPWFDLWLKKSGGEDQQELVGQYRTALELLKVFRSLTLERYLDGGVVIDHVRTEFRDLP